MKMIPVTCHNCLKTFERSKKEVDRQIRNNRPYFFCSLSCSTSSTKTLYTKTKSSCLFCHKEFETTTHKKARKCCSKNCAVKYAQSKVDIIKHVEALQKIIHPPKTFPKNKEFVCVMCGNKFLHLMKNNF